MKLPHAGLRRQVALVIAAATVGVPAARAQQPGAPDAAPTTKMDEAGRHFQRGIELYKAGDFGAALVQLKAAYELVPNYKVLYNLGQVSYQRHDYAGALKYFRQYLGDGDDQIPPGRQREVAADLAELEQRVGHLQIETPEQTAKVFVDDILEGTTPLHALIIVNAGKRTIDLVMRNGERRTRMVDVGGGEIVTVSFPQLEVLPPEAPPPRTAASPRAAPVLSLSAPKPPAPPPAPATAIAPALSAGASPPVVAVATHSRKSTFPWKSWTLTGLLAGGAATTGVIALQSKQSLDDSLNKFPQNMSDVDFYKRRTRDFAMVTDGLIISTAAMAAISLYFTLRDPG
jgi:hypothetical protein